MMEMQPTLQIHLRKEYVLACPYSYSLWFAFFPWTVHILIVDFLKMISVIKRINTLEEICLQWLRNGITIRSLFITESSHFCLAI